MWWLIGAALFGVSALAIWTAFKNPAFVAGLFVVALKAAADAIIPQLGKRMTPAQEKAFQDCQRRGGEWDPFRKRCRQK